MLSTLETLLNTKAVLECFCIWVQGFEKSVCAFGGQQELLRAEHSGKLFGCQWRTIWLHLSWKSNPLFLGTLNSWNNLLSHLVFCMGSCDLYLQHCLLYLSQLWSYLCCAYFKLTLYRPIKIFGVIKREMRVVGGKITRFEQALPSVSLIILLLRIL